MQPDGGGGVGTRGLSGNSLSALFLPSPWQLLEGMRPRGAPVFLSGLRSMQNTILTHPPVCSLKEWTFSPEFLIGL